MHVSRELSSFSYLYRTLQATQGLRMQAIRRRGDPP